MFFPAISKLEPIARAAGDIIMAIYSQPFTVEYKGDESPLTAADKGAHEVIVQALAGLTPDAIWDRVNLAWVGFFTVCGLLNLYVAFNLPQEMWVNFKVFGLLGMTLVFTLLSGVYLYRHLPAEQKGELKK